MKCFFLCGYRSHLNLKLWFLRMWKASFFQSLRTFTFGWIVDARVEVFQLLINPPQMNEVWLVQFKSQLKVQCNFAKRGAISHNSDVINMTGVTENWMKFNGDINATRSFQSQWYSKRLHMMQLLQCWHLGFLYETISKLKFQLSQKRLRRLF